MKTVKDFMQDFLYSCAETDNIEIIASWMSISDIKFLPVLDQDKCVVGTVTYDKICNAIRQNNLIPTCCVIQVGEIMNKEPISLHAFDDEATAFTKMRNYRMAFLPVVDDDYHLKGVVSFTTLARRIVELKKGINVSERFLIKKKTEGDIVYN